MRQMRKATAYMITYAMTFGVMMPLWAIGRLFGSDDFHETAASYIGRIPGVSRLANWTLINLDIGYMRWE